jgi:hypothetical protein
MRARDSFEGFARPPGLPLRAEGNRTYNVQGVERSTRQWTHGSGSTATNGWHGILML